ncbi:MAG: glycosyltransferase 87 family protein [Frankia sp.]|nr:glycosyltransferase 87 family protein [Frankia sp.]
MTTGIVLPSREAPIVRGATTVIGGPVGGHARIGERRFWTPLRVVLALTALTFSLGYFQKAPCRTHPWAHGYQNSRMCYSDVFALYYAEGINEHKTPYVDHPVEYPVVIGGLMWAAGQVVKTPQAFFDVTAVMMGLAALVAAATVVVCAGRRRPWDAAMFAVSLALFFHGLTNWDLAAVAFTGLGLASWARRRPATAGVWWGLGIATKLYPVFFAVPLAALCWRARRMRAFLVAAVATVITWAAVNLPVFIAAREGWARFYVLSRNRGANWESLWYILEKVRGKSLDPRGGVSHLNLAVTIAFVLLLGGVLFLAFAAPRRPRLAPLLFLTLASFVIVNKVYSPQYVIWLTPFAVLARPRWRAFLVWQAAEAAQLFFQFYFFLRLNDPNTGLPLSWFQTASFVRYLALIAYMGLVVRDIWRPEHDVVRSEGVDDPAGGVLADAPDAIDDEVPAPAPRPVFGAAPG